MPDAKRLKYEKPISVDMGRVAPILGDTCSVGNGASDCPSGMNNSSVPVCNPSGLSADNDCRTGSNAGTFCWPSGSAAHVYCLAGSGYGESAASSYESEPSAAESDYPEKLYPAPEVESAPGTAEEPGAF